MKTLHISTYKTLFIAFCTVLALTGCSDDQPVVPVVAGVQPEVINNIDTFEFQVSSVENYTGVWRYDWTTTGTIVNVDQSSAISGGTVILRILDSNRAEVYSRDLTEGGSFVTEAGATGQWSLEVALVSGSGTLNFRTEKNQ